MSMPLPISPWEERGLATEKAAIDICKEIRKKRLVIDCWRTVKKGPLDLFGVDLICQNARGYFFLNVKSSKGAADAFFSKGRTLRMKFRDASFVEIYPWVVDIRSERLKEVATTYLLRLLSDSRPSSTILPEEAIRINN